MLAMDLKTYLLKSKKTQDAFARELDVTQGLISQWIKGVTVITPEQARKIDDLTGGKVSCEELRPDVFRRSSYQ